MKKISLEITKINDLVHIAYDNLIHEELENHERYIATVRKLKHVALENTFDYPVLRHGAGDFNNTELDRLEQLGFKYACFWVDGSIPTEKEFETELLEYCKELDEKDPDWLAIGHILDRSKTKGSFPYFHENVFVMNLKVWAKNFKGSDGYENIFHDDYIKWLPKHISSDEHIHDDYTPMWVKQEPGWDGIHGSTLKFVNGKLNRILVNAIKLGLSVYNFPHNIRKLKRCFYIEDHIEETLEWLFDDSLYMAPVEVQNEFKYKLRRDGMEDKIELFAYKRQTESILYVTNTESVPEFVKGKKNNTSYTFLEANIQTYVAPCSGFNQFDYMIQKIDTLENVIFFDANSNSVRWMEYLVNTWDGVSDVNEIIDEFISANSTLIANVIREQDDIDDFLRRNTEEQRRELFNRLREKNVKYVHCDIMRGWKDITAMIPENTGVWINLTNIWLYEGNFINNSPFHCNCVFYNLLDEIYSKSTDVIFKGSTPSGALYEGISLRSSIGLT